VWSRAAIHRMGKVVSCLTRAASASLPGSFFSRQVKSASVHPKRAISDQSTVKRHRARRTSSLTPFPEIVAGHASPVAGPSAHAAGPVASIKSED